MIPFCTSSSSGIGRSGQNLADNAGTGTWLDGMRFGAGASEDEIRSLTGNGTVRFLKENTIHTG